MCTAAAAGAGRRRTRPATSAEEEEAGRSPLEADPTTGTAAVAAAGTASAAAPSPSGRTLVAASPSPSPTCTSITTTVMLSAPPCSLATSTSCRAAAAGSSTEPRTAAISSAPTSLDRPSEQRTKPVARVQLELPHVGVHLGGDPERPGQDVPLRVDRGLLLGHLALAHPLFGQAVIVGDLGQAAAGEHVGPRVPHVGQGQHVVPPGAAHQRGRGQRGSHAAQVGVGLALVPHGGVGLRDGLAQPRRGRHPLESLLERLDGHPRRHLATHVAAHPVGHRVEVGTFERQVLVDGANTPDVGRRAGPQDGHRETSNTVEPIWRRSPFPSRTALEICSRLTNVPLVEPRSSTHS